MKGRQLAKIAERHYWLPRALGFLGVVLSISGWMVFRQTEDQLAAEHFRAEALQQTQRLNQAFQSDLAILESIASLYAASEVVKRDEFRAFVAPLLKKHQTIRALEWVPRVDAADVAAFEQEVRGEGYEDYTVSERGPEGTMVPVSERDVYYPVRFVEPLAGNEKAFGFDLGSESSRVHTMNRARMARRVIGSARIDLVQEDDSSSGWLVFYPVFANEVPGLTDAPPALEGFALGVYLLDELLKRTMEEAEVPFMELRAYEGESADEGLFFYAWPPLPEGTSPQRRVVVERTLMVADAAWTVELSANEAYFLQARTGKPIYVFLGGLFVTGLLIRSYLNLIRRQEEVDRLVAQRTRELSDSNRDMALAEDRRSLALTELRSVVDVVIDGLVTMDAKGTVSSFNAAAERIFGYEASEVIGNNVKMLMPEPFHSQHDGYLGRYQVTKKQCIIGKGREVLGRRKDGTVFPMDLAVTENVASEASRFVGLTRDITDRKKQEEERAEQRAALETSNRDLEEFAYIISHDLQEPLRKIQSFGDLLLTRESGGLSETGRDYLERMHSAATRMRGLIQDLLSYSRVGAQGKPFAKVDLNEIVKNVLSDLEARIQETGADVAVSPLPAIEADKVQMRQLIQNLLGNALKFTRPDTPPLVRVYAEDRNGSGPDRIRLTVEDNGIGIDEKYREKIFHVFKRLHRRGEYEGTGIGLSICRKIVERHHGEITVDRGEQGGAIFHVDLPRAQSEIKGETP